MESTKQACSPIPPIHFWHLRNYPIRFAWKLLEMRPRLVEDRYQVCRDSGSSSDSVDLVEDILKVLSYEHIWEEAKLFGVVSYLRGAKGLKVPLEYKRWLPDIIPDVVG